jgi:Acetyltransferase (GNAT) domain
VAYSHRIFDSIEQVDAADWQRVRSACDGSIVMDPRFIAAVEVGMKDVHKFWYIIVYDEGGAPVACTSASAMTMDIADFADPGLARIIRHTPLLFSPLRHLKLLVCGLPIGTGLHTLGVAPRSAAPQVLPVLEGIIGDLAAEAKADAIVCKEFGPSDLDWTEPLLQLGYRRLPAPPSYNFKPVFEDFAQYCAALKKHYRWEVNRSRRKLKHPGFEETVLTDPQEIVRAYTSEAHALYHQMADRAAVKMQLVPIEFLHELTLRLDGQVELVAIRKDGRIVAFCWCLHAQSSYYTMYAGLDYELNHEFDLYFNLMYAMLDRGLRKRVSNIVFGIGGDAFKARLGCYSEPLYVFGKARGLLMSLIVRAAGSRLIAHSPAAAPFNIFRENAVENSDAESAGAA